MKRQLLAMTLLLMAHEASAQANLAGSIRGEKGVSLHFVRLNKNQQTPFNPNNLKMIFGLDAKCGLVLKRAEDDKLGNIHYRYYQTYGGIPIENSMYIVHTRNAVITGMSGTIITEFDPSAVKRSLAAISKASAVQKAISKAAAQVYAWQDESMQRRIKMQARNNFASYEPAASLVWYNSGQDLDARTLRLCYKVDVYAIKPLRRADYFVDAATGEVIGTRNRIYFSDAKGTAATYWSGSRTIHSDFTGSNYRLRDYTRSDGIITLHGETGKQGDDYFSDSANWTLKGINVAALDAHYGVEQTYAFYQANFNRNSYDGIGGALYSYVNDPTYLDNAFWDGTAMYYNKLSTGEAGGVTAIDITGHELTHGVTQESCNLDYAYEPGAINESLSDIMGKSVQFWAKPNDINWRLSNDMNWIIRDMSNPNLQQQADTYKGKYWYKGFGDNGGVHYNSGVGNFMFYLLVNGGSGTNDNGNVYDVGGIGLAKADQIIYRSQTVYLVSTSKYVDWRLACINAANDLYGPDSYEVAQVKNAFFAVGIGANADGCDIPYGLTTTNIKQRSAVLNWNTIPGVNSYNIQYKALDSATIKTISNIPGDSYNLKELAAATTYSFQVESNCPSGTTTSGYSKIAKFTTLNPGGYCSSSGQKTDYEYIQSIVIETSDHVIRKNNSGDDKGYGNYTGMWVQLTAGKAYTLTLTPGFTGSSYPEDWAVYIDFNQNGKFSDPGELVAKAESSKAVKRTFTVPLTAKNGHTLGRVQMAYAVTSTDPCAIFSYGEVEDYSVKINVDSGNTDITSKNNRLLPSQLSVVPNPVKGNSATVHLLTQKQGNVTLRVTDLSGRLLLTQKINSVLSGKNLFMLSGTEKLNRGVFIITAEQNNVIIGRTSLVKE